MALLRPGDAVYADGVEMLIQGPCEALQHAPARSDEQGDDPRLLRGVGGQHHGRSFTLDRPRVIGRGPESDILVDDPAFAEQHARLERHGDRLLLRDLGAGESTRVNGVSVRHCWLQPGDQLVFDAQHRFVLEVPHDGSKRIVSEEEDELEPVAAVEAPVAPRRVSRWPWLLGSALLLGGVISLLLLFGAR